MGLALVDIIGEMKCLFFFFNYCLGVFIDWAILYTEFVLKKPTFFLHS